MDNNDMRPTGKKSLSTSPNPKTPVQTGWRRLLTPPIFVGDEEKTRTAQALHVVLLVLLAATSLAYFSLLVSAAPVRVIAITALIAAELISFALLHTGYVRQSALFLTSFTWFILVVALTFTGGVDGSSNPVQTVVILTAGLLLGGPAALAFAGLSTLAGLLLLIAEVNGVLPASMVPPNPTSYWIFVSLTFFASAGLLYITTASLREAIQRARRNEATQIETNLELQAIRQSLEQQVADRTHDLEQRSRYLQATIEVSRAAASILDEDQLMQQAVDLIQEQFQLYYVGLFLADADGEWAVHRAGTGQAGRTLLQRGHRIRIGTGMIGWSIANSASRIALSAAEDAQRLATPELPDTLSEAAIPLRSRGKTLGAISVQSEQPNAFGEVEIISFQAMADQVALSIDNARLFEESQSAIREVQRAYGIASRLAWKEMLQSGKRLAYRYEKGQLTTIDTISPAPGQDAQKQSLRVPITVRDQIIGFINLQHTHTIPDAGAEATPAKEPGFTDEQVSLLRILSEQLGIALESARLYQDSQRLALREQLTSEVTSRIRETLDMEAVLKTAVQEIQQTMGAPEVIISLKSTLSDDSPTGDLDNTALFLDEDL